MRKSILILLVGLASCRSDSDRTPLIRDFTGSTPELSCAPLTLPVEVAPTEIRQGTDSTWTVLDAPQRRVFEFDDSFRVRLDLPLAEQGPGAAPNPASAVVLGDSAVAVAARGSMRLVVLGRDGAERRSVQLDFIPNSVEAGPDGGLWITPVPFGGQPRALLLRETPLGWTEYDVPARPYDDMSVGALGNSVLVETLPDGRALALHQFFRPRAYRVEPDGTVHTWVPPLPEEVEDQIGYQPRAPITDDQIPKMALPAMAVSVDPASAQVLVLTRSGGTRGGQIERAVIRMDVDGRYLAGYRLPVHAVSMAFLPRVRVLVLTDDLDRFHACRLPAPDAHDPA